MSDNLDKLLKQLVDLHPKFIDLSLTRLKKLLKKLKNPHLKISLLNIDIDFVESTYCSLKYLYPKVSKGGILKSSSHSGSNLTCKRR